MIIMIIIYNIILISITILLLPLIIAAFIVCPKLSTGWIQKIGFYTNKDIALNKKTTVFHAVSVGETNAIKEFVKEYRQKHPEENIIITTTTKTGQDIAKKAFNEIADKVVYFPYDFFFSVLSFFKTYKPEKIIIAETEIWPCFVTIAEKKGINVYTINGRLSPHSFSGYKKIKILLSPVLNKYEKFFMQSKDDAIRMIEIGAKKEKVEVMGNLKFDISTNLTEDGIKKYTDELKTEKYRILIAASTHHGEDEIILRVFNILKSTYNDAKLLLAPRHPQRYEEVIKLLNATDYSWGKRSNNDNFDKNDIILLDTMGELAKLFSICYLAFIGGSFSSTGGHNPLEAAIWNKPVLSGPTVFNFKDIYKIVTDKNCAVIVNNEAELTKETLTFFSNKEKYNDFCKNAKSVFEENQGAIKYILERI